MTYSMYQVPEEMRGFKGFLRMLAYRMTFYSGLICAILNAFVFLFGPSLFNDGTFEKTFANFTILALIILVLSGTSGGLFYLLTRMRKWWPSIFML